MPRGKAVTHADLAPSRGRTHLGSKTGAALVVLMILCGLLSFILCLVAEATRSQVTWESNTNSSEEGGSGDYECVYSGSGKMPLLSAASAFLILAMAMVVEHTYLLIAVSKLPPSSPAFAASTLTWHAAFFFVSTWISFAVGEILLLIGLSVESGHLRNWARPRPSCLVIREGLFCAAGVFALATVFLAAGLYLTALRAEKAFREQEIARQEMLEASALYASPPQSPPPRIAAVDREDPATGDGHQGQQHPAFGSHSVFSKFSDVV
ncbi:uncharacterized protein LOC130139544 [Syzygium oleosum]|uniref:uncharacterized protein LOC115677104 n=1 Tax=Syzygium oleosum TaxID=219896 RepID=UPI0011D1E157|nr:uncharacterized protein LOC115677104 [Syzygium oleosum]XP_056172723.1 uncharacterized protein LOC130139544 [Syzygium oleosum]